LVAAGRYDQAEACFRQLEAINPAEARASLNLAVIYEREGRLEQAVAAAAQAVRLAPGDYRARSNYAALLTDAGQTKEAEAQLLVAVRQHPDYADSWINFEIVRVGQGRLTEAAGCFARALAIRSDSEAARQNLARVRLQLRPDGPKPTMRPTPARRKPD